MAGGGSSFSSQLPQTPGPLEPQPSVLSAAGSQRHKLAQLQLVAVATDLLPSSPQGGAQATRAEAPPTDRE